jgi:hypothetical protein
MVVTGSVGDSVEHGNLRLALYGPEKILGERRVRRRIQTRVIHEDVLEPPIASESPTSGTATPEGSVVLSRRRGDEVVFGNDAPALFFPARR